MSDLDSRKVLMGVDVGITLNVVVRQQVGDDRTRAVFIGEVDTFEDVTDLMSRHSVHHAVIDAQPDLHKSREFAKLHSKVWLAFYSNKEGDHEWRRGKRSGVHEVHINRTQAFAEMFDLFNRGKSTLPANARQLGGRVERGVGEYYRQMMALKRILDQNAQDNWVSRYVSERRADHYAHAEVYCMLASKAGAHSGVTRVGKAIAFGGRRRSGRGPSWRLI